MMQYFVITIPSYGLMAVIGLLCAATLLYYRGMVCENSFNFEMSDFGLLCLSSGIGCLAGSRLLFVITQIPDILQDFDIRHLAGDLFMGGFVFYGGLFGAYAGVVIYSRIGKYDTMALLDFVTPAFVLFHVFGRIGCLLAGCCYGFELDHELVIGNVHFNYFPLQAVESFVELIFFILLHKTAMKEHKFVSYISCYAVYRFIAEFFRGDSARGFLFGISTSQWVSVIVVIAVIAVTVSKRSKKAAA